MEIFLIVLLFAFLAYIKSTLDSNFYRIEPNYGSIDWHKRYDKVIETLLTNEPNLSGWIYSGFFPSSKCDMYHPGFCLWISVARYIYGKKLDNNLLKKIIIDFFKDEYKNIFKN